MKKGLEVGIGFIITIIIAVMALVMAIQFLQSTFPQIQLLTDDVIKNARADLIDKIQSGDRSLGITIPNGQALSKINREGRTINPELIIKSDESQTKCYNVNVRLTSVDPDISNNYFNTRNCRSVSCPDFASLQQEIEPDTWFTPASNFVPVGSGEQKSVPLIINVKSNAFDGEYGFTFDFQSTISETCPPSNPDARWKTEQEFLRVKVSS